jgi:hypothetical protein
MSTVRKLSFMLVAPYGVRIERQEQQTVCTEMASGEWSDPNGHVMMVRSEDLMEDR